MAGLDAEAIGRLGAATVASDQQAAEVAAIVERAEEVRESAVAKIATFLAPDLEEAIEAAVDDLRDAREVRQAAAGLVRSAAEDSSDEAKAIFEVAKEALEEARDDLRRRAREMALPDEPAAKLVQATIAGLGALGETPVDRMTTWAIWVDEHGDPVDWLTDRGPIETLGDPASGIVPPTDHVFVGLSGDSSGAGTGSAEPWGLLHGIGTGTAPVDIELRHLARAVAGLPSFRGAYVTGVYKNIPTSGQDDLMRILRALGPEMRDRIDALVFACLRDELDRLTEAAGRTGWPVLVALGPVVNRMLATARAVPADERADGAWLPSDVRIVQVQHPAHAARDLRGVQIGYLALDVLDVLVAREGPVAFDDVVAVIRDRFEATRRRLADAGVPLEGIHADGLDDEDLAEAVRGAVAGLVKSDVVTEPDDDSLHLST